MVNWKKSLMVGGLVLIGAALLISGPQAKKKKKKSAAPAAKGMMAPAFHPGTPLSPAQMDMMKSGAMKNMDKYMGNMEAMRTKLPQAMMSKQKAAIARGKELFNDTKLSTNGRACATCHPGGATTGGTVTTPMKSELTGKPYELPVPSLAGAAATFPKFKVPNDRVITLPEMDNNCIMMFMGAQPMPLQSDESRALASYITTLSDGEAIEVGKVPEMMKKMMSMGH
ncbi:MAG: c-type cytochrome [Acidobacteriota bacterium]